MLYSSNCKIWPLSSSLLTTAVNRFPGLTLSRLLQSDDPVGYLSVDNCQEECAAIDVLQDGFPVRGHAASALQQAPGQWAAGNQIEFQPL